MQLEGKGKNRKPIRPILSKGRPQVTTASQTNGATNITNKLDIVKQNLQQLANRYEKVNNPHGFVTDLSKALCANLSNNPSNYVVATILVNEIPTLISIRVSGHHANADNFPRENDYNLSIMVSKRYKKNTFKANDEVKLDEYVYMGHKLEEVNSPFSQICISLIKFLNGNDYVDTTGIAFRNTSPQTDIYNKNKQLNCNRNMKQTIRLTENELRGMINEAVKKALSESDYQVPDNIDIKNDREWEYYDDNDGIEEYEKLLSKSGKMPKGYDKDITFDSYEGGNALDKLHFLNEPYPVTPMKKKSEIDASWNAIDREYDKKKRRLGSSVDDMDDENYEDYFEKTFNANPNNEPWLSTKYVALKAESIVRGIVHKAVNEALKRKGKGWK